jgi:purine-binding chemotaxis protein CheW
VREVSDLETIAAVPGSGPAVLGVLNLRGRVLPAFDLARVLGIQREQNPTRLVIAEHDGRLVGLAVDEVSDVGSLDGALDEAEPEYLAGSTLQDGELVGLLDVGRTFAALERHATG